MRIGFRDRRNQWTYSQRYLSQETGSQLGKVPVLFCRRDGRRWFLDPARNRMQVYARSKICQTTRWEQSLVLKLIKCNLIFRLLVNDVGDVYWIFEKLETSNTGYNFKIKYPYDHLAWVMGLPVASLWILVGGALFLLSTTDLTFTILAWMPQPMQYCILM